MHLGRKYKKEYVENKERTVRIKYNINKNFNRRIENKVKGISQEIRQRIKKAIMWKKPSP